MKKIFLLSFVLASFACAAQDSPTHPVRMLVGFPPGGAMDSVARVLTPKLAEALGQPFLVENRPGAGGAIAADALGKAGRQGYTRLTSERGPPISPAPDTNIA